MTFLITIFELPLLLMRLLMCVSYHGALCVVHDVCGPDDDDDTTANVADCTKRNVDFKRFRMILLLQS